MDIVNKHYELKKHVAAIHSSNKLSLVQRKIANALLFNAYKTLSSDSEYKIHIKNLCELIGYNSNEQKAIKNALVSLISTVIEWNLVDKDKVDSDGVWNASAIIADASIDGPTCTYSYSNKMRELLHSPEIYGRLNMKVQAKFKSSYGLALYENCIRYQNINETPWFDMPTFRKLMGVDEGKYSAFKDFRKRVIDVAVKEVSQHSHMTVDYSLKKAGRKFVAVKFTIHKTSEAYVLPITSSDQDQTLSEKLKKDFGFSKSQISETLERFEESYILEKMAIVRSSPSFREGKILNLAKYLQGALLNDYQAPKESKTITKRPSDQANLISKQHRAKETKRAQYDNYRHQAIIDYFETLGIGYKQSLLNSFMAQIANTIYENLYGRDGLENAIVARKFTQFLREQNTVPQELVAFEEFEEEALV